MHKHFVENIIKNVVIVVLLIASYSPIHTSLSVSSLGSDTGAAGSFLIAVSIIAVIGCFGNFTFTYEKSRLNIPSDRLIAHMTTGLLMLVIGLSLEMTAVVSRFLVQGFFFLDLTLIALYVAMVLYDFWDIRRAYL